MKRRRKPQPDHIKTAERTRLQRLITHRFGGDTAAEQGVSEVEEMFAKGQVVDTESFRLAIEHRKLHLLEPFLKNAISNLGQKGTAEMIIRVRGQEGYSMARGGDGEYANSLHRTLQLGHPKLLGQLLGILDEAKIKLQDTPHWENLMTSAAALEMTAEETTNRIACLEMLLTRGLNINTPDRHGSQAIHHVSSAQMTRFLASQGADLRAKDGRGNRPLYTLWLRRNTMRYRPDPSSSREEVHQAFMETAYAMLEWGAQIKDGPPIDIMKMNVSDHPISAFLIAGRRRDALMKVSGRTQPPTDTVGEQQPTDALTVQRRRPHM